MIQSEQSNTQKLPFNLILIGFMGTGKTTVANTLRRFHAMDVVEMDQMIAEREGMSVPAIFQKHGEPYFRDAETRLLIELQVRQNTVISCGGGTPLRKENVTEMKKNGKVILLTAEPETILARVRNSHSRPLLEHNKNIPFIADLLEQRRSKYEAAADIIIRTDSKSARQICEEIITAVFALPQNHS